MSPENIFLEQGLSDTTSETHKGTTLFHENYN